MKIVNTPVFQRLRDIRQLAVAHYVYPGASHSRLEHSLGCVHLTTQVFDQLLAQQDRGTGESFEAAFGVSDAAIKRGRTLVRLAALLHDIGHSAFSHSGEHVMPIREIDGDKRRLNHEDMTRELVLCTEIGELIDRWFANEGITKEQVVQVATKPQFHPSTADEERSWMIFLNELIAGELGADRMDYLLRDATHSGQETGRFDHRRLIDTMLIAKPPEEEHDVYRLAVGEGGILAAEQMIASRYLMYITLYFHKTKRILEKHMELYLPIWLERQFGTEHLPVDDLTEYQSVTDSPVWASLVQMEDKSSQLAIRDVFLARKHHRLAAEFRVTDLATPQELASAPGQSLPQVIQGRFDKIRQYVQGLFGPESIVIDVADHSASTMHESGNKMWVVIDGKTRYLREVSEVISGMSRRVWRARIYAPEDKREDVAAKAGEARESSLETEGDQDESCTGEPQ